MSTTSTPRKKPAAKKVPAKRAPARKTAAPRTAKQPTDHLTPLKAEATGDTTTMKVTVEGVKYVVDPQVIDDVNMVEMIGDIQYNDEGHLSPLVIRKLIGEKPWREWKVAHTNAETGRIPVESMSTFLYALFAELNSGN